MSFEVEGLEQLYSNSEIEVDTSKKYDNDLIGDPGLGQADSYLWIILQDFNLLSFSRDFVLSSIIAFAFKQLGNALKYLRKEHLHRIHFIELVYYLFYRGSKIEIKISFPENRSDQFIMLLNEINIHEIVSSHDDIAKIQIKYLEKSIQVKIEYIFGEKTTIDIKHAS